LPGGHFQPLASPDPLDPLVVDQPAGPAQQLSNLAITVAAILPGQLNDVVRQPGVIVAAMRDLALRRAMLVERRTGTALGNRECSLNMLDAGAATRGAQ
jgi:DhnA family fructose-bisphosphate aldolase class Ia